MTGCILAATLWFNFHLLKVDPAKATRTFREQYAEVAGEVSDCLPYDATQHIDPTRHQGWSMGKVMQLDEKDVPHERDWPCFVYFPPGDEMMCATMTGLHRAVGAACEVGDKP